MRYYLAQSVDRHILALRTGLQDAISAILAETLNSEDPRLESLRVSDHLLGALSADLRRFEHVIVPQEDSPEEEPQGDET